MWQKFERSSGPGLAATRAFQAFTVVCFATSLILLSVAPSSAHHSRRAFDRDTETSITGTIKAFELVNPHAWIYVVVTKPDGTVENWDFEGGSVRRLNRAGWSQDMLKEGDEVTIEFNPMRDGSPGGIFRGVTTADGRVYSTARRR